MNMYVTGCLGEPSGITRHMKIKAEILYISMTWRPTDKITNRKHQELSFDVSIATRQYWKNGGPNLI